MGAVTSVGGGLQASVGFTFPKPCRPHPVPGCRWGALGPVMERAVLAEEFEQAVQALRDPVVELPPLVGQERRLHVRAYAAWSALRAGGSVPTLSAFTAADRQSFADHGVLLSLGSGSTPGRIGLLGEAIAHETGLADGASLSDVDDTTMLAALAHRLIAIATQRVPMGFEADYPDAHGRTLSRGILLPLAGQSGAIEHVYAVIGQRHLAAVIGIDIRDAVAQSLTATSPAVAASAWQAQPAAHLPAQSMAQTLAGARTWAALAAQDPARRDRALAAALSATHDLLIEADFCPARLVSITPPEARTGGAIARAVRLVFGGLMARDELRGLCHVLARARRLGIGKAMLGSTLGRSASGIDGFIAAAGHVADDPQPAALLRLTPLDPTLLAPRARTAAAVRMPSPWHEDVRAVG